MPSIRNVCPCPSSSKFLRWSNMFLCGRAVLPSKAVFACFFLFFFFFLSDKKILSLHHQMLSGDGGKQENNASAHIRRFTAVPVIFSFGHKLSLSVTGWTRLNQFPEWTPSPPPRVCNHLHLSQKVPLVLTVIWREKTMTREFIEGLWGAPRAFLNGEAVDIASPYCRWCVTE